MPITVWGRMNNRRNHDSASGAHPRPGRRCSRRGGEGRSPGRTVRSIQVRQLRCLGPRGGAPPIVKRHDKGLADGRLFSADAPRQLFGSTRLHFQTVGRECRGILRGRAGIVEMGFDPKKIPLAASRRRGDERSGARRKQCFRHRRRTPSGCDRFGERSPLWSSGATAWPALAGGVNACGSFKELTRNVELRAVKR
jgi:hypothetical protein